MFGKGSMQIRILREKILEAWRRKENLCARSHFRNYWHSSTKTGI